MHSKPILEALQYDMLTNTDLRVAFPRWPPIGFKIGPSQTIATRCSIQSYFSDQCSPPYKHPLITRLRRYAVSDCLLFLSVKEVLQVYSLHFSFFFSSPFKDPRDFDSSGYPEPEDIYDTPEDGCGK